MKHFLTVSFILGTLISFSYAEESVTFDKEFCGVEGSVEERIEHCSSYDSRKEGFILVARTKKGSEVHKDLRAGLVWSERLAADMNHDEALEACKNDLEEVAGINLNWRLPSSDEYVSAEDNGIRNVLSDMKGHWYWSSSTHPEYSGGAWLFNTQHGYTHLGHRFYVYSVRCVATI